ncbi:MAG: sulfite exporter TauE/SafE family protein [Kineosporiaceae bacterium]
MQIWQAVAILAAGVGAGTINTVVGSGSLITFPTLLALGVPAVPANVSNTIGLVCGGFSSTWAYRRELAGNRDVVARLAPASLAGAVLGALLLLLLPDAAFGVIVPVLIVVALLLVAGQPFLARRLAAAREQRGGDGQPAGARLPGPVTTGAVGLTGVYGGYFGAAQGVVLVGLLGVTLDRPLQHVNAVKNILATGVNLVAAAVFLVLAHDRVHWSVVALIAVGSVIGGVIGGRVGRALSPVALRAVVLVVGVAALVRVLTS